jgi:hypothetical protein
MQNEILLHHNICASIKRNIESATCFAPKHVASPAAVYLALPVLEVCRVPDLGLVEQKKFGSGPRSGRVQMIPIKRCIKHFGLSRTILLSQRESYS